MTPTSTGADTAWFIHDRFGLFIHWGIYSAAARHEWVKNYERITDEDYQKYFDHFDPDLYDPAAWAQAAKHAGMKYFVVTSKHHDGFCLWDSALTDYKAPNTRPTATCSSRWSRPSADQGFKVGFYHSLIDWHHPDFPVDGLHPMRDDVAYREADQGRDIAKYRGLPPRPDARAADAVRQAGHHVVRLLLLASPIGAGPRAREPRTGTRNGCSRWSASLQPGIIVNDRLEIGGDIKTPEQYQPRGWLHVDGKPVRLGGLPDAQRLVGLPPRQPGLEVRRHAGAHADRLRLQGRQPAAERGAQRPRRVRAHGHRPAARHRRMDAAATAAPSTAARASRLHPAARLPLHPERQAALPAPLRLALPPRAPGRPGATGSSTPNCSTTPPRSR